MIRDITLGQFFPGTSLIHRLDPRMKVILTVIYITMTFLAKSLFSFVFLIAATAVLFALSGLPFKVVIKGVKPLLFIIVFTAIINIFRPSGQTLLINFYFIRIYLEGIIYAIYMIIRIVCLLLGTSILLTYTTSPFSLTAGVEQLLGPLKKIKVPVHEFSMMMSIALRFIPTLIEETDKIMNAQKARGADFTSGNIIQRVKALIPVLIPLFVSSLRRADELATAMECRCYRGGNGRTRMNSLRYSPKDFVFLFCSILGCAAVVLINRFLPFMVM